MGASSPVANIVSFKAQFSRDFIYGPGPDKVTDLDIQRGLNAASSLFNPDLFDAAALGVAPLVTSESLLAYLYLSAHFMVTAVQAAGGLGKTGRGTFSQGGGIISGKGAGGVSVNYTWPSSITDNPALFQLVKTTYGQMYLQMLLPRLVGNIGVALGNRESDVVDNS